MSEQVCPRGWTHNVSIDLSRAPDFRKNLQRNPKEPSDIPGEEMSSHTTLHPSLPPAFSPPPTLPPLVHLSINSSLPPFIYSSIPSHTRTAQGPTAVYEYSLAWSDWHWLRLSHESLHSLHLLDSERGRGGGGKGSCSLANQSQALPTFLTQIIQVSTVPKRQRPSSMAVLAALLFSISHLTLRALKYAWMGRPQRGWGGGGGEGVRE